MSTRAFHTSAEWFAQHTRLPSIAGFALDSANLCSLVPDIRFSGFSSPSWYVKTPGSFFCLHVEQLFAPFYNLCYEGSTTWWVVRTEDNLCHSYARRKQVRGMEHDVLRIQQPDERLLLHPRQPRVNRHLVPLPRPPYYITLELLPG